MKVELTRYEVMVLYRHYAGVNGIPAYQESYLNQLSKKDLWRLYISIFSKNRENSQKDLRGSSLL
jgi:hypothetical protein